MDKTLLIAVVLMLIYGAGAIISGGAMDRMTIKEQFGAVLSVISLFCYGILAGWAIKTHKHNKEATDDIISDNRNSQ